MGVSKNNGTPKSSNLVGCSIIFTIHFGVFPPIFGNIHIYIISPIHAVTPWLWHITTDKPGLKKTPCVCQNVCPKDLQGDQVEHE